MHLQVQHKLHQLTPCHQTQDQWDRYWFAHRRHWYPLLVWDDKKKELDLYIKDALFVHAAPIGLLRLQQIAQQTCCPGDGFNALSLHGILTFDGYTRTIPYDVKCRLLIMSTVDGVKAYTAFTDPDQSTLTRNQKMLMKWHQ